MKFTALLLLPFALLGTDKTDLFTAGEEGYHHFRIPGIVVTAKGTLLAYVEARRQQGDWADIDVLMRRSTDGGRTWGRSLLLADFGEEAANNPVAIASRNGVVHFLYCRHYAQCFDRRSSDDGLTFSEPVDITATFERFRADYDWNVIAIGPGHGIELRGGRLLAPVWLSTGGRRHRPSVVSVIYSDDRGKTWERGEILGRDLVNPSETLAAELEDGRVMLNIRNESPEKRRAVSFSRDGATGWTKPRFVSELVEPVCMASLIKLPGKAGYVFANPDNLESSTGRAVGADRKNVTVQWSADGLKWTHKRVLEPGASGYSDLAAGSDGTVYCLYERGAGVAAVTLARFPVNWIREGK
ncbi:MAG: exo-alpha-sialidase [Bryobacterales bacterium]|nr:exo-alpha-sialidase [Bryobacterales bacterium]